MCSIIQSCLITKLIRNLSYSDGMKVLTPAPYLKFCNNHYDQESKHRKLRKGLLYLDFSHGQPRPFSHIKQGRLLHIYSTFPYNTCSLESMQIGEPFLGTFAFAQNSSKICTRPAVLSNNSVLQQSVDLHTKT